MATKKKDNDEKRTVKVYPKHEYVGWILQVTAERTFQPADENSYIEISDFSEDMLVNKDSVIIKEVE